MFLNSRTVLCLTQMNTLRSPLLELCAGLNALGQQLQLALEMSKHDKRKNLIIILYSHVLDLYQKTMESVEDGRLFEAKANLPAIIDGAFAAAAVIHHPAVAADFYDKQDVQRIFRSKSNLALPRDVRGKIRSITGLKLSARAGLAEYYRQLERIAERAQTSEDVEAVLIAACEGMLMAARQVADFFAVRELDKEFYEYWSNYSKIVSGHGCAVAVGSR